MVLQVLTVDEAPDGPKSGDFLFGWRSTTPYKFDPDDIFISYPLRSFGCIGDGVTDDTTAYGVAKASGKRLTGKGLSYAVNGDVTHDNLDDFYLENATIIQLSPNSATRKTFHFTNSDRVTLKKVKFDRNGDGTEGAIDTAAALFIDGGTGHRLIDIEATGDGKGTLIKVANATGVRIVRPYVHDIDYDDTTATDDQNNCVWLNVCEGSTVEGAIIERIGGNTTDAVFPDPYRLSRGVVFSGCTDCGVIGGHYEDVDQSIDFTGSAGNFDCYVLAGTHKNIVSNGVKFANSAVRCSADGAIITNVGYAGGIISGPAESGLTYKTQDCTMRNFKVTNPGYNGYDNVNAGSCCTIEDGDYDHDHPKGCLFENIEGIDDQMTPTMTYVVRCEVAGYDSTTGKLNETKGIRGTGYQVSLTSFVATGDNKPFAYYMVKANRGSDQTISTGTTGTTLGFTNHLFSGASDLHDTSSNTDDFVALIPGIWKFRAKTAFAANATGVRRMWIDFYNGSTTALDNTRDERKADASIPTHLAVETELYMNYGEKVKAHVAQSSGGDLAALSDYTEAFFGLIKEM